MHDLFDNPLIIKAAITMALAFLFLLAYLLLKKLTFGKGDQRTKETLTLIKYLTLALLLASVSYIWLESARPVVTIIGVIAATLVISLKEPILSFFGATVIFWREIFAIGERIEIGGVIGDVVDKGLLYFTLMEVGPPGTTRHSTGRLVKVPNSMVLTHPIMNATRGSGHVWLELGFIITPDSDHEWCVRHLTLLAEELMIMNQSDKTRIKYRMKQKNVHYNRLEPKVYTTLAPGGLKLTLRFLCPARLLREGEDYVTTSFVKALKEHDRARLVY